MFLRSISNSSRRFYSLTLTLTTLAHKQAYSRSRLPSFSQYSSSSLSSSAVPNFKLPLTLFNARLFSSNQNNGNDNDDENKRQGSPGLWKFTSEDDGFDKSLFGEDEGSLPGVIGQGNTEGEMKRKKWTSESSDTGEGSVFEGIDEGVVQGDGASGGVEWTGSMDGGAEIDSGVGDSSWDFGSSNVGDRDVFGGIDSEFGEGGGPAGGVPSNNEWLTAEGYKPWTFGEDESVENVLDVGVVEGATEMDAVAKAAKEELQKAEKEALEREEKALTAVLKGPERAFGDLVAASGISDAMLDSLMALKDFKDIEGLPPLPQIEDERYEKTKKKSIWGEIERQKQEAMAKSRARVVDEKGRAYGTGRRKCSIACVWIQPGDGKFSINEKEFDVYFPMLDHRAALLRPFSETNTLGLWDVSCTVKGGGTTGQVGAIRLGISRALQNWEPGLRPPLKQAGFLTRDPRVVERKKPGKAKARKSFQWVKR